MFLKSQSQNFKKDFLFQFLLTPISKSLQPPSTKPKKLSMRLKKPSFERESPCMAEIQTKKYTHPEENKSNS